MKFTFAPGSTPLEGFTIRRAIHRGGFGEVYYATSDEGRETALKLLQNNLDVELRGVRQCLNLSHPNLVTIFDVKQDGDGDYWIVMEYVPGDTLAEVIRKQPEGVGETEAVRWMDGIASAVSHLHSRGLVHRDLKPGNVFADGETVKVGDVGLSKFISPSKQSAQTQSVGTVYYMAPEVAQGKYGPAVDQYALGIIAYELLTGRVPFDGESTGEILLKHLTGQPDLSLLPDRVRPVVAKALAKTPDDRFGSIDEYASAFRAAIAGEAPAVAMEPPPIPVSAEPATPPPAEETASASLTAPTDDYWSHGRKGLVLSALAIWVVGTRFGGMRLGMMEIIVLGVVGMMLWNKPPHWAGGLWRLVSEWTTSKIAVAGAAGIALMAVTGTRVDTGIGGLLLAGWIVALVVSGNGPSRAPARAVMKRHVRRGSGKATPPPRRRTVDTRSSRERAADWASSASLAPLAITVLTAVTAIVAPDTFSLRNANWEGAASVIAFGGSALLGVWALLGIGQTLTLHSRSGWHTRFVSGLYGAGVGVATWAIAAWLAVPLPEIADRSTVMFTSVGDHSLLDQRHPTLAAFTLFFATLFFLRSWIRQTFPLREHRLRIGSVIMSVVVAWLASKIFAFPTGWAMLWAAVVSCGLQSVATWSPEPIRGRRPAKGVA